MKQAKIAQSQRQFVVQLKKKFQLVLPNLWFFLHTFLKLHWIFLLFLIPYLCFVAATYHNYGIAIDEPVEYQFGEMLYARNFGRDPLLLRDFAMEHSNSREIWAYNHFHVMTLFMINDSRNVETYHLLNFIFAIIGFYLIYELVLFITRKPIFGLLGSYTLFFTPRFLGDIASNVKDPVFSIYYLAGIFCILIASKINIVPRIGLLGISFGFSAAARILGYSLIPFYFIFSLYGLFLEKKINTFTVLKLAGEIFLISLVAIGIHAIQMPFVASNPIPNLIRLVEVAKEYPWHGQMLYWGNVVSAGELPWHYLPVWIGITTPLFILIFWVLSHGFLRNRYILFLHFVFYSNLLLYFVFHPIIYDGLRHYLFLIVIMSALGVISFSLIFNHANKKKRLFLISLLTIHFLLVFSQFLRLHPYEYTYFNELTGYISGVNGKFETDYWGTSYKEGALYLNTMLEKPSRIGMCGNRAAETYFSGSPHTIIWIPECNTFNGVDYVMTFGRNGNWDRVPGKVVHTVSREGVPLLKIFKLP